MAEETIYRQHKSDQVSANLHASTVGRGRPALLRVSIPKVTGDLEVTGKKWFHAAHGIFADVPIGFWSNLALLLLKESSSCFACLCCKWAEEQPGA